MKKLFMLISIMLVSTVAHSEIKSYELHMNSRGQEYSRSLAIDMAVLIDNLEKAADLGEILGHQVVHAILVNRSNFKINYLFGSGYQIQEIKFTHDNDPKNNSCWIKFKLIKDKDEKDSIYFQYGLGADNSNIRSAAFQYAIDQCIHNASKS